MSEFHFLRPYWWLALIPVGLMLWQLWRTKYTSRGWRGVCDARLLPYLLTAVSVQRRRWPLVLLALMLLLTIAALAGPVWKKIPQPVFRKESALVIAVDLSRSMDATDIKPSRLARARLKVIDILRRRQEGQTALVAYAADAFTVSPLTEDSNTIVALDKTLSTDLMPAQGSNPAKALQLSTKLLQQAGVAQGDILLITDGVESSQVKSLAALVSQQGHRLFVLGVGTKDGAPISLPGGGFVKDQKGNIVIPKINPVALQQLAELGHGRFHLLTTDDTDLNDLLAGINGRQLDVKTKASRFIADRWQEEGPWLLLIILPFAALAFRRGYLVVLLVCTLPAIPRTAYALEWSQIWQRPDQQAAKQLRQQKMDKTDKALPDAEVFHSPEWKAAAYYRHGEYKKAAEALKGINKPDAFYNKGNALAKMGDLQGAIHAYDQALKLNPRHADAKYNRQQVEQQLKKQQQKSNKQSQQGKSGKDSKSKQQSGNKQQSSQDKSGQQQKSDKKSSADSGDNKSQQGKQQSQQNQQQQKPSSGKQQQAQNKQAGADDKQDKNKQAKASPEQGADQKQAQQQQQDKQAQQTEAAGDEQKPLTAQERKKMERQQADEQWLRRIPDDPGGLLRRKFKYQYQQRQAEQGDANGNDEQQSW